MKRKNKAIAATKAAASALKSIKLLSAGAAGGVAGATAPDVQRWVKRLQELDRVVERIGRLATQSQGEPGELEVWQAAFEVLHARQKLDLIIELARLRAERVAQEGRKVAILEAKWGATRSDNDLQQITAEGWEQVENDLNLFGPPEQRAADEARWKAEREARGLAQDKAALAKL